MSEAHILLTVAKGMCKSVVLREMHPGNLSNWSGLSPAVSSQARFLMKCSQTAFQIMSFSRLIIILFVTGLWYRNLSSEVSFRPEKANL